MATTSAGMEARDVTIPSADGTELRAWHWPHPAPAVALVISHGLGEHAGCYRHVAEALGPAARAEVVAFDYRGHGRSPGRRGFVRRYEDLVDDLHAALSWAGHERPGLPRVVLGHSNGGLVAIRAALDARPGPDGLILSNPLLRLRVRVPRHKVWVGHVLRVCAPGITLSSTDAADVMMTRDPAMLAGRPGDPLRHARISAPLYFGMLSGGALALARAGEIRVPTLLALSESDPVIDPAVSRGFFDRLGSPDKALRVYPEMLHEPLNEIGRERVLADLIAWLRGRFGGGRTDGEPSGVGG